MTSPAVAHGMGLFETMLVVNERAIDADAHFARMAASAAALGFPLPDRNAFTAEVAKAATGEAVRCLYLEADRWLLHASAIPIPPLTMQRRTDARAVTLNISRSLPEHKLTSYAACAIGLRRAAAQNANEGFFLDANGNVLEGTATNVFAVRGRTLITAGEGILPGIVRRWVLDRGMDVELRAPSIAEIHAGAFLTGCLTGLAPLRMLDGVRCDDPGEVFQKLRLQSRHFA
ncbi:MAG TPA: aminotransferase class IV [Thermoanaerobaculia bacterium]|nr:aminotransferase class IV [Thermoanaerobaculia bacterium]